MVGRRFQQSLRGTCVEVLGTVPTVLTHFQRPQTLQTDALLRLQENISTRITGTYTGDHDQLAH